MRLCHCSSIRCRCSYPDYAVSKPRVLQTLPRPLDMLRKRALSSNLSLALHSYSKCAELRSVLRRHSQAIALSPRRSKALPCSLAPAAYPRGIATQPQTICDRLFEEERLPGYDPDEFYPVYQGDTIKSRYRVIGKLGYGASSTVWFCRDLR